MDREIPSTTLRMVGRALYLANRLPIVSAALLDHGGHETPPPAGRTVAYGAYLAGISGCRGCHNPDLSGGPIPGMPPDTPPAANITPTGIGRFSEADFTTLLREGRRPDGTVVSDMMPVRFTRQMTDDEIAAVYAYLRQVTPRAFAERR